MDWSKTSVDKSRYYQMLSVITMKRDCETLKALVPIISHPIIALGVLPYFSLFCTAINEYDQSQGFDISLPDNSSFNISDVRNKLKLFNDKYQKSQRQILAIDDIQSVAFKRKLRFSFLGRLNCYYNLGIFVDSNSNIIGNTQLLYYILQDKSISRGDIKGDQLKTLVSRKGCNFRGPNVTSSDFVQQSLQGLLTEVGAGY